MDKAFDIVGLLGFVLSLILAAIEIVRNRRNMSLSNASFLYVENSLYRWILLDVIITNKSSLPISIMGVGLFSDDGQSCRLMEQTQPFMTFSKSPFITSAFTPSSFPVELSPFSSQQVNIVLIPIPEHLNRLHLPEPDNQVDALTSVGEEGNNLLQSAHTSQYQDYPFHLRLNTSRGSVDLVCVAKRKQLYKFLLSLTNNVPYRYSYPDGPTDQ